MRKFYLMIMAHVVCLGLPGQELHITVEEANKLIIHNKTELTIRAMLHNSDGAPLNEPVYILPGDEPEIIPGKYQPRDLKEMRLTQDYDLMCFLIDLARWEAIAQARKRNLDPNTSALTLRQQAIQILAGALPVKDDSMDVKILGAQTLQHWLTRMKGLKLPPVLEEWRGKEWEWRLLLKAHETGQLLDRLNEQDLQSSLYEGLEILASGAFFKTLRIDGKTRKAIFPNLSLEAGIHSYLRFLPGENRNTEYRNMTAEGFGTRNPYYIKLWFRYNSIGFSALYARSPLMINQKDVEGGYLDLNEGLSLSCLGLGLEGTLLYELSSGTYVGLSGAFLLSVIEEKRYKLTFQNNRLEQFSETGSSRKLAGAFDLNAGIEKRGFGLKGGLRLFNYKNSGKKGKYVYALMINAGLFIPLYKISY